MDRLESPLVVVDRPLRDDAAACPPCNADVDLDYFRLNLLSAVQKPCSPSTPRYGCDEKPVESQLVSGSEGLAPPPVRCGREVTVLGRSFYRACVDLKRGDGSDS